MVGNIFPVPFPHFDEFGIVYQATCPGIPEQNGVAEKKNKHLLEIAHAIMFTMNVSKTFWFYAIQIAAYLMNMMFTSVLSFKSPLEVLSSGTPLFSLPLKKYRTKLDLKALKCVFFRLWCQ